MGYLRQNLRTLSEASRLREVNEFALLGFTECPLRGGQPHVTPYAQACEDTFRNLIR